MLEHILRGSIRNSAVALATVTALAGNAASSYAQSKSITTKPTEKIQRIEVMVGTPEEINSGKARQVYLKDGQTIEVPYEQEIYVVPQAGKTPAGILRSDVLWKLNGKYITDSKGNRLETYVFDPERHGVGEGQTVEGQATFETLKDVFQSGRFIVKQGRKSDVSTTNTESTPAAPITQPESAPILPPQARLPTPPCEPTINTVTNYVYNTLPCEPEKKDRKIFEVGAFYDTNGMLSANAGLEIHGKKGTVAIGGSFGRMSSTLNEVVQNDTVDTRGPAGVINSTTRVTDTHDVTEVGLFADLMRGETGRTKIGLQGRLVYQGIRSDGYTVLAQVKDSSGRIIANKEIECVGDIYSAVLAGAGIVGQFPVKKNSRGETTVGIKTSVGAMYGGVAEQVVPTTDHIINYRKAEKGRKNFTPYISLSIVFGK